MYMMQGKKRRNDDTAGHPSTQQEVFLWTLLGSCQGFEFDSLVIKGGNSIGKVESLESVPLTAVLYTHQQCCHSAIQMLTQLSNSCTGFFVAKYVCG